jgi:hypothetical protein
MVLVFIEQSFTKQSKMSKVKIKTALIHLTLSLIPTYIDIAYKYTSENEDIVRDNPFKRIRQKRNVEGTTLQNEGSGYGLWFTF